MDNGKQHIIERLEEEIRLRKQIDTERNWQELSGRMQRHKWRNNAWRFARNAAAILLLPALITTFYLHNTLKGHENRPIEQIEQTTPPGLVSKVTLPDGSEVWLNSGSTLTYPQRFAGNRRQVALTGEAYFRVKADREHRFEVQTGNQLTISAYGTEFNVYAYPDEPAIEATLVSGNIEVTDNNDTKTIAKGQQAIYGKEANSLTVADVNLAVKTSWKDGKMVFRRANMTEITHRLARKFNVDIHLEGEELLGYEYSATFTTETLDEILNLLEKSAPIKCRIIEPEQSADYSYSKRTVIIGIH